MTKTLNDWQRYVLILWLVQDIRAAAGWCGPHVLQKCAFFLQEMLGVPLDMNVIRYVYAPYSCDLSDDVSALLARRLLNLSHREPYGTDLALTEPASGVFTLDEAGSVVGYRPAIHYVAERLGDKPYLELERLSMALWISQRQPDASRDELAQAIHRLVSRIEFSDAQEALDAVERMRVEREALTRQEPATAAATD